MHTGRRRKESWKEVTGAGLRSDDRDAQSRSTGKQSIFLSKDVWNSVEREN